MTEVHTGYSEHSEEEYLTPPGQGEGQVTGDGRKNEAFPETSMISVVVLGKLSLTLFLIFLIPSVKIFQTFIEKKGKIYIYLVIHMHI